MYLPTFLSLSVLALLQLGATQEFVVLTRNQLRGEIRAGIAAALSSSGNQSPSLLNFHRNTSCSCDRLNTLQEAVGRLQQHMNISAVAYSRGGCSSTSFSVQDVQYTRVCGKIIGYQQKSPDAFGP